MSLFGQIPASTKRFYLKRVADGVYAGHPVLWMLTQKKMATAQGGDFIVEPLILQHASGGAFAAWDTLAGGDNNELDAARYNFVSYYGKCVISGQDYHKNMGPEKAVDLYGSKMAAAELEIRDQMAGDMFLPTGSANPIGLTSIDEICDTQTGTVVGGLDGTDALTWLGNNRDGGGIAFDLDTLELLYTDCTEDQEQPDLGVVGRAGYAAFWSSLIANQRYLGSDNKVGFKNLIFNDAAITMDTHLSTATAGNFSGNRFYLLNTNYLGLVPHENVEFVMEEKVPTDQWGYLAYIYWMGNLTCNNRRFQGVMDNFT